MQEPFWWNGGKPSAPVVVLAVIIFVAFAVAFGALGILVWRADIAGWVKLLVLSWA